MNLNWYEGFFQGIVLDMWQKALPAEAACADADFLERALKLRPGSRVLDVPCGLGRHSIELASRGYKLTSVDLSAEGIAIARKRGAEAKVDVDWRQADMRELPWEAEFDAIFCFGNSFGYLDPPGMRAFVAAVARALKRGGRFAMDSGFVAESILTHLREREWAQIDDILFLEENRYHVADSCLETVYTFQRRGETVTRSGFHWVYTLRELRALLAASGLVAEEPLSSLGGEPFRVGSPYMLLAAEKA
ncbi:MAG TPA: methyltransferase domain-containing protein [Candidatus Polarisedimenticolaceae bacterium]|nr:methyltransferase domain-containing protein [Candidatus Polarisedimenticolaceae bacterium]